MMRSFPTAILQDPVFLRLDAGARLTLFTLWMHPGNHFCGLFCIDEAHLVLDTKLTAEQTSQALAALEKAGLIQRQLDLEQIWVPRMTALIGNVKKDKTPINTALTRYLHGLPPSALVKRVCDTLSIPYRYPIDTLSNRVQDTPSDSLPDTLPDRALLGIDSGIGSGSTPKPPDQPEPPKPIQLSMSGGVSADKQDKPDPVHVRRAIATVLFAELQQARKRCNPRVPRIDPKPLHLRELEGRLRDGLSADELRSVIHEVERRVKAGAYSFDHFDHVSPFRASNVTKYTTASTPTSAAKDPNAPILPPDTREQTRWLVEQIKREKAQREANNAASQK